MKSSTTFIAAFVLVFGVGGIALGAFGRVKLRQPTPAESANAESNVFVADGKQIVDIKVKAGYQPQTSAVKAGVPTILRFETNGTFDCSSTIRIPSLGITQTLPSSGATNVAVGALPEGKLQGTCGMGMYQFSIDAQG